MTRDQRILAGAAVAGGVLVIIGARFLLWPETAARTFGVGARPEGSALSAIIGLRDVWLGVLALAFVGLREWRGLALWLGLGVLVCLADAALVAATTARPGPLAFHLASGLYCAVLAHLCARAGRRAAPPG
jgi:hypothetical protein